MHTQDEDEARRRAVVIEARRRMHSPGFSLMALSATQLVGAVVVFASGRMSAELGVTLSGLLLLFPFPVLLAGGLFVRQLRGWNLCYIGLLGSAGLWALASIAMQYVGFSTFPAVVGPGFAILVGIVGTIWMAQLGEQAHVRAAMSILQPLDPNVEQIRGPL